MNEIQLKYGCNPNQKPSRIYMEDGSDLPVTVLNGKPGYIMTEYLDALTEEDSAAWNQAQGDFTQALGRLMVADENYPELRDLKAFQDVRDKLSGAVNRLAEARRKYNEQAKVYNVKVQTFPNNILAGMFGFQPMFYYEAPAGTEEQTTDFSRK